MHAEDYYSDKTLEDADVLYSGMAAAAARTSGSGTARTCARGRKPSAPSTRSPARRCASGSPTRACSRTRPQGIEGIVRKISGETATIELTRDYRNERHNVWGITARNREQNFALNLLMDPEIDFVTVLGPAGTGKTLLALAAGLMQTLETNRFVEIIMTRVTIPLGEDIGFLPGTEEEKMEPWMGALMDNLEVLTGSQEGGNWGRAATNDLLRNRIKIRSLNFMRGRTFLNRFLILDEAQNLTPKQMKALITRAGPGTKLACLGNIAQIDTPLPDRDDLGADLCREPLPRLEPLRAHHPGARGALAAGGLRLRHPVGVRSSVLPKRAALVSICNHGETLASPPRSKRR